jgi:hypothetical protein
MRHTERVECLGSKGVLRLLRFPERGHLLGHVEDGEKGPRNWELALSTPPSSKSWLTTKMGQCPNRKPQLANAGARPLVDTMP